MKVAKADLVFWNLTGSLCFKASIVSRRCTKGLLSVRNGE